MRRFCTLAMLSVFAAGGAGPATSGNWFFIQMTDPQFGMAAKNVSFAQETANFEFAVAAANRLKPRFVIVTGDLVNKPGDAAQIAEYKRICAKLDPSIRLYHVAGNHDVDGEPTPGSLAVYRERIGPDYYGFREGGLYGIVLNSTLIHSPAKAPEEDAKQWKWLEGELAKAKSSGAAHVVVFLHHPLFLSDPDEKDGYFNIPAERRKRLLESFRAAGVRYVFSGHYHRNAGGRSGGIDAVTTGPVGPPLGDDRSGFRLVWVTPNSLPHRFYDFGALPAEAAMPTSTGAPRQ